MKDKINEKKSLLREAEKMNEEAVAHYKKERKSRRHGSGFFGGILTKIIIILFLLIILLGGGYYVFTKKFAPKKEVDVAIVMSQLSLCQELVTAKNRYSDIVAISKSYKFVGKSYAIVKYTGIIRIGIPDITQSDIEVYNEGKSLKIRIPDVEILGNDIESQEVFDESHNIFIPITLDEVFTELEKSKEDTLEELINEGILHEARENAKKVIQQIMLTVGFEEVIVV